MFRLGDLKHSHFILFLQDIKEGIHIRTAICCVTILNSIGDLTYQLLWPSNEEENPDYTPRFAEALMATYNALLKSSKQEMLCVKSLAKTKLDSSKNGSELEVDTSKNDSESKTQSRQNNSKRKRKGSQNESETKRKIRQNESESNGITQDMADNAMDCDQIETSDSQPLDDAFVKTGLDVCRQCLGNFTEIREYLLYHCMDKAKGKKLCLEY